MIEEHDRVVLNTALSSEGLEAGDVGTVVHRPKCWLSLSETS